MELIRVKYEKKEEVKYVGHLDTMRTFMRCLKRTIIPVEYSKGFNPRIKISFALPLGVGVTSDSEYFDLELKEKMNIDMFVGELNSVLPKGFKAISAFYPEDLKKSLMSLVKEAIYEIIIRDEIDFSKINSLFTQDEIWLDKTSKSGKNIEKVDIKKNIIDFKIQQNICVFHVTAGSVNNVNPNTLVEAISMYVQKIEDFDINRKELILGEKLNGNPRLA